MTTLLQGSAAAIGRGFLAGWWLLFLAPAVLAVVGAAARRSPRSALAGAGAGLGTYAAVAVGALLALPGGDVAILLVPASLLVFPVFVGVLRLARGRLHDPPYAATSGRSFAALVGVVASWGLATSTVLLATQLWGLLTAEPVAVDWFAVVTFAGVPTVTALCNGVVLVDLASDWRSPDLLRGEVRR